MSLTINKHNNLVIRLSSESWDTILNSYAKYFDSIYGEKYIAFQKLSDIQRLTSNSLNLLKPSNIPYLPDLALATHIVYDLSLEGVNRKLSLSEQLSLFGISFSNIKLPIYTDNQIIPSIFFIIGFWLGDGTLYLRLRNSDKGSIWLIPTLLLPQLKNKYNSHFFSMLEKFFKSLNIKTYTINKIKDFESLDILNDGKGTTNDKNIKEMSILTVENINSIFYQFLPVIKPYSQYLYWKIEQYDLMYSVAKLVSAKTHYTLYGFLTVIEIIYNYPNKRHQSKEFWFNIIQSWFKARAEKNISRENNIQAVYGRGSLKSKIVAWKCVFPVESKIKSRQFGFTNNIESREALNRAIQYRDITIKSWVDSLK